MSAAAPVRVLPAVALALAIAGCASNGAADAPPPDSWGRHPGGSPREQTAEQLLQVSSVHEATGLTLLEGPAFDAEGDLFVVDVTAPPGEPKVLRIDVRAKQAFPVYTDESSAFTSAQFSPYDGRLYLTDFIGGRIVSIDADGEHAQTFFADVVEGAAMNPDDIAFDEAGNLFISDSAGYSEPVWDAKGRVVRIDRDGSAVTVLANDLPAPNGISFSPEFDTLWISQNTGNRIDRFGLDPNGAKVVTAHPALYVSGGESQVDSTAVDSAGNIYVGMHGQPKVFVYSPHGELLMTVTVPVTDGDFRSATNLAIAPGTTDAYATVSGPDGGFIYVFEALSKGVAQPNGG